MPKSWVVAFATSVISVGLDPGFVWIELLYFTRNLGSLSSQILFQDNPIPADKERHNATGAVLGWKRDHRKPIAHFTIGDVILCTTFRAGALGCEDSEIVSAKWIRFISGTLVAFGCCLGCEIAQRTGGLAILDLPIQTILLARVARKLLGESTGRLTVVTCSGVLLLPFDIRMTGADRRQLVPSDPPVAKCLRTRCRFEFPLAAGCMNQRDWERPFFVSNQQGLLRRIPKELRALVVRSEEQGATIAIGDFVARRCDLANLRSEDREEFLFIVGFQCVNHGDDSVFRTWKCFLSWILPRDTGCDC